MKASITAVVAAMAVLMASLAYAAPGTGTCVQGVHDLTVALLDSPTDTESSMGDAISDGFFGNEPNVVNTDTNLDLGPNEVDAGSAAGYVEASLTPGPETMGGNFITWGSVIQGAVKNNCI